jgi:hypothetical protein
MVETSRLHAMTRNAKVMVVGSPRGAVTAKFQNPEQS